MAPSGAIFYFLKSFTFILESDIMTVVVIKKGEKYDYRNGKI